MFKESYFPTITKVPFVGTSSLKSGLGFHYYNPEEVVAGRKMKDWLRFSVAFWHTFDQQLVDSFGDGTAQRPYHEFKGMDLAKARVEASFEFYDN